MILQLTRAVFCVNWELKFCMKFQRILVFKELNVLYLDINMSKIIVMRGNITQGQCHRNWLNVHHMCVIKPDGLTWFVCHETGILRWVLSTTCCMKLLISRYCVILHGEMTKKTVNV